MYSGAHNLQLLPYGLPPSPPPALSPWKPSMELAPNCPRCGSSNTKFCYYNNYSLTQPRYFCKGCRRYWTEGGSLRNVPVGGGCRKNRRSKSIRPSSMTSAARSSSSLRPDLALDDMFRSSTGSGGEAASEQQTIDLAVLYSKFLNQRPTDQLPKETDEPFDQISSVQLPNQGLIHCGIEGSLLINDNDDQIDVLGFSTDTTGFESLDFSGVHGGSDVLMMPNCPMAGYHDFPQVSHQCNALHDLVIGDLYTLDQFSFEHL